MIKSNLLNLFLVLSFSISVFSCSEETSLFTITPPSTIEQNNQVNISAEQKFEKGLVKLFSTSQEISEQATSNDLFPGGIPGIDTSDIQQGKRPVCYFLSALAGLSLQRPQDIQNLVKANEDGTYTVTFPGLPESKRVITVDAPTEDEMLFNIHKGQDNSIWVPVIIKAISKYWSKNGFLRFFKGDTDAAHWGGAWEGIEIVTGNVADFMLVNVNTNDRILNKINQGLINKKLVSVSTFGKGNNPKQVNEIKLSRGHVLSALSVDLNNKTITVRDPYGHVKRLGENKEIYQDRSTDGVFTLKVEDFRKYFFDVAIETDKKSNFFSRLRFLK
jgi:hypothetical protein